MPREDLCDKVLACVLEALLTEFLTVVNPYPQENSRLAVIVVAVLDHDELHECHEDPGRMFVILSPRPNPCVLSCPNGQCSIS
ncbi:unnamed protein product [Lathyrus oleraceus]